MNDHFLALEKEGERLMRFAARPHWQKAQPAADE
jgi:hypothetical protein